ncbi:MAG: hypothetical protein V4607_05305 [Pseudomonadota bacterium]
MTRAQLFLLCCGATLWSAQTSAHEGEVHEEAAATTQSATTAADKPQRLANGDLYISKAVQRLLGIRTEAFIANNANTSIKLQGEISTRPEARSVTSAPQAGVLEATEEGRPLPGAVVKAGQVLAYLEPQISLRDAAARSTKSAEFEQRLTIAQINVDRLQLQNAAGEGDSTGNVYYEQAVAELESAKQQRDFMAASLHDRLPLRAAASGVLIRNKQRSGEMVVAGQSVFEVANSTQLRVVAYTFDPRLLAKLQSAKLVSEEQGQIPLRLRGQEALVGQPGWKLLFDVAANDTNLLPGMPVNVELEVTADAAAHQLAKACVISQARVASVWLHIEAERFAQRQIATCDASKLPASAEATLNKFKTGDRLVVAGGALLSQYH